LGQSAGANLTAGNGNIDIGNLGVAGKAKTIRIGNTQASGQTNTYIAGISGVTVAGGITVIVDSSGHLGTTTSSARYKEVIKPMDKASEAILALEPVTFRYKKELDPNGIPQFGLVAEEVAKVDPDLVARDDQGKPYTVRHEAVNAMLLNEFLKEHRRVEEQTRVNREQETTIADLRMALKQEQKQIAALTSQMQRVSDQLQASGTTLQIVARNQ
jgi:2,3-bisphosphoglycerate-independent phosphoglycerate mutase